MADVGRIEVSGRAAWRKRYTGSAPRLRLAALRWCARRLGLNALIAPIPLDARAACATERRMIGRLAALGVRVPEVLAAEPDALVLSDLGPTLSKLCKQAPDAAARAALVARGFAALADLHARGGYASQPFARNLAVGADGGIGFIDLEEDPLLVMPLAAAQARDVLFYVHSSARFLVDDFDAYAALLRAHAAREPAAVRAEIVRTARRFRWLAPLCRPFGGRARALAAALRALAALPPD